MTSDVVARTIGLVWTDDATLYVANDDGVVEVGLESGVPTPARTILIEQGLVAFYGVFDAQPLIYTGKELQLGQKTLLRRDSVKGLKAIATEIFIFVSAPPSLLVFDRRGQEIYTVNPGRSIDLGSLGEDPNSVYGVAENTVLVRIFVGGDGLHIEDVSDLAAK